MNTPKDNLLEELAKAHGESTAKEFDSFSSGANQAENFELNAKIEAMILEHGAEKKTTKYPKKLVVLVAVFIVCFVMVGGLVIKNLSYSLSDNGLYSDIIKEYSSQELRGLGLRYLPRQLPEDYKNVETIGNESIIRIYFENPQHDTIIFTQSNEDLLASIDTENAEIMTVVLYSGYEGIYIEKNGATLIWEQNGKFYMLYSTDSEVDLLAIASSLEKV